MEKDRSYKTGAEVEEMITGSNQLKVKGKLLLYFSRDSGRIPAYGDRILIRGGLQRIRNAGNPGEFDYEQYMSFQNIFHRAYLKKKDYILLPGHQTNALYSFVFFARKKIIDIIQENVRGSKKVTGIAEAMFIGYKEDLDRDEVQAYRNAGVVHIIIIAGMHLGLISAALIWVFIQIKFLKRLPFLKISCILICLWLFALITGASVPVLRSAVMFTCIIIGKYFFRKPNSYNSLAASAFILLCYDPFLLWDAGFQLSYCAVAGILWLQKPISGILYFKTKFLRKTWEVCSLSLAAQSLILPLSLYYFHTLPIIFLVTNLLCVPLFTVALFGEIFMVLASTISFLATTAGRFVYVLTGIMNFIIDTCNRIPFSLITGIYSTVYTVFLLYGFIICFCTGLLQKSKRLLRWSALFIVLFILCWSVGKISVARQKKIVIYNINRHTGVDLISENTYQFFGDSQLTGSSALQELSLGPSRISLQAEKKLDSLEGMNRSGRFWKFYSKTIMIIDSSILFEPKAIPLKTDILLICGDPKLRIAELVRAVRPGIVVLDGSNSLWKIGQWKKECEQLHLACHVTAEQGAYMLNVQD